MSWLGFKLFLAGVPRIVWQALAVLVLAVALLWVGLHWLHGRDAGNYERGRTSMAEEIEAESKAAVVKRDTISATVATETKQRASKAVAKTEGKTHEREAKIAAVPVSGACVVPDGLPDLAPAVAAANAADG